MNKLYLIFSFVLLSLAYNSSAQVVLPLDFELDASSYDFLGFEGAESVIEANPDMNGNASATVMRTTKTDGAQFFAGTFINLDEAIDFSNSSTISVGVWSPKADIPVRLRLENADNSVGVELDQMIIGANAWEALNFDLTGLVDPAVEFVRVVIFFEFVPGLAGDGSTYFFDNISVAAPPMASIGLPVDFELGAGAYDFGGFEGADSAVEANPDMNGNESATIMRTTKTEGAQFFAGTFLNLDEAIDFSSSSTIAVDVWSPKADIPVRLRLENADNSVGVELDQTIVGASAWETLNFDFTGQVDPAVEFVRVVIFFEFVPGLAGDGSTYFFDNIAVAAPPMASISLPIDFELGDGAYDFLGFEGAESVIEANPDMNGNPSATVMRTTKTEGAQFFAGTFINLDEAIDFSSSNTISVDVWSPKAGIPVRLRLENADNSIGVELDQTIVGANAWETLNFDLTGLVDPAVEYVRVVLFFEFVVDLAGDGSTYFFDNIAVATPPSPMVSLPIDFELGAGAYDFLGFEGAESVIEANPDMNGNPSATVMRTTKTEGAQFFAGTFINLDVPVDFSTSTNIAVDVWSPKAGIPVRMRLENADNSTGIELDQTIVGASAWETLNFDFADRIDPAVDYVRVVLFFEFVVDLAGDGSTYFFDNIEVAINSSSTNLVIEDLDISPNPANDYWQINSDSNTIEEVSLFDNTGKRIYFEITNANNFRIPAANLVPGFYIATLSTTEGTQAIKLIKH